MAIGITALGTYAPDRILTNTDLETMVDTTAEWITSRTGINERRIADEHEYASTVGIRAVQDLVRRHPTALDGVDMVVCATSSPDAFFPSTAALIAGEVGLAGAGAMDVSTACSGFVYALATAHGLIAGGVARKVLVIGSETLSKIVDWTDRGTCILFGDGAGAAVIGEVPDGYGFQSFVLGADSAGGPSLYKLAVADRIPGVNPDDATRQIGMNGREVFKFAVRVLGMSGKQALEKAGLTADQVDWLVPHQANIRIIEAASERFGIPMDRTVVNLGRYGNTSTATVPLALQEALDDGRIQHGQQLLLVAFGGGLSWAAGAMRWYGGEA
ncbi:beta-ketoacyl-ACP synthase III [Deinococcus maricopensis]|uniref:Beta-ketoacyl-[acyl-carrier-protein] synthase III n=1 Tax=Deinococcus maricopensis (strain DSM 21211 / LMG 22137 / NRRL B-23946 / LB-34) TaxID=709986 RepID=E8U4H7_DEIML|nr:beta-ketoacyl-ACP synthase III [Deinococcus maricopensis]ADV68842.1 3-oxoacyl-(acyl-carrier-protein) synthase 3 [Deinococcus maricopensis DSM 21211]